MQCSGRESFDDPGAVFIFAIAKAVVQAARLPLPELDALWRNAVAAPEIGQRNFTVHKFLFQLVELLQQELAGRDDGALV